MVIFPKAMESQRTESPTCYQVHRPLGILRSQPIPSATSTWSIDPYQGCELGCTFCPVRLPETSFRQWCGFEKSIGVRVNAASLALSELRAMDFAGATIVLGASSDPWQPSEQHFRLTRSVLAAIARAPGVNLWVNTRSSLIARDIDLLRRIAANGSATISIGVAAISDSVNRVMEPRAPSALRRLTALEALARAGLRTGVMVAPVYPGIAKEELGLTALLARVASAGGPFAGLGLLEFAAGQRERFFHYNGRAHPRHAFQLRRWVTSEGHSESQRAALRKTFEELCQRFGLSVVAGVWKLPGDLHPEPSQLPLFQEGARGGSDAREVGFTSPAQVP